MSLMSSKGRQPQAEARQTGWQADRVTNSENREHQDGKRVGLITCRHLFTTARRSDPLGESYQRGDRSIVFLLFILFSYRRGSIWRIPGSTQLSNFSDAKKASVRHYYDASRKETTTMVLRSFISAPLGRQSCQQSRTLALQRDAAPYQIYRKQARYIVLVSFQVSPYPDRNRGKLLHCSKLLQHPKMAHERF